MSSKGNNGNGASQNGSGLSVNYHVDKSVAAAVASRQAESQASGGGTSNAVPSSSEAEPESDPPDPDAQQPAAAKLSSPSVSPVTGDREESGARTQRDLGAGSDERREETSAEVEESGVGAALPPIRSVLRSPGPRSNNTSRHVTIVESDKPEQSPVSGLVGSNSAPQLSSSTSTLPEDAGSIRVTEQIKQGTFKEAHIIFKAGPPLAETLPKLEKKEEATPTPTPTSTVGEAVSGEATTASAVSAGASTNKLANANAAAVPTSTTTATATSTNTATTSKPGPTNEEKKKNREDRKKEKEKKKEEEMLFHHEREQEKKTKIVGTDKYNPETGEFGQWLKHAFLLGEGSYKNVYEGYNAKDGCKIAWCEYKQPFQPGTSEYSEKEITSESAIMKRLHHPHIVRCYDVLTSYYDIEEKRYNRYLVLIQERMEKDSLKTRIQRSFSEGRQHLSIRLIKRWMLQMLEAVSYLHKQKPMIIHRDLKPENIFMMSRESEDADDVKIGDFGLASYRDRTQKKTLAGTFGFMAPEMYGENYDEKVDIYALGMVWLEMFTNQPPFHELRGNFFLIASQTLRGKSPLSMNQVESMAFRELIMALIHPIPHWRPSAELLMHHPLLQTKSVPIIIAYPPQICGQEFVANMGKNHKLEVSVRLYDKKLRSFYGLDEGQCLNVDIDLYKEQAIEKTVEELQRDIETTLAENGAEAAKFSVPKKWYDSVRMQLRLHRHLLLGQRWRYIYAQTYPERVEKHENKGEPYFGPHGLPAIFFGGTGIVSVGPGATADDLAGSQSAEDFYSNSDEGEPNCFLTSAKQIKNMNHINQILEKEVTERVMLHIKKAADPRDNADLPPIAPATAAAPPAAPAAAAAVPAASVDTSGANPSSTANTTSAASDPTPAPAPDKKFAVEPIAPEPVVVATERERHQTTPPRTAAPAPTPENSAWPPTQWQAPPSAAPVSQPPVPTTQPLPVVQPVAQAVAQAAVKPASVQPVRAPTLAPPYQMWSQPQQLQHPPQGLPTVLPPLTAQHMPWPTVPDSWPQAMMPGGSVSQTQPMWTQPAAWPFPTWSAPQQTPFAAQPVPLNVGVPPGMVAMEPPPPPAANNTSKQPPTPHSAPNSDHIDSAADTSISMPSSMAEVGLGPQPVGVNSGFVQPGNLATIGGPVSSSSKGTKKKRVGGSGQSGSSKKRENCKVCLTHTDTVENNVTRMHIQVHLPDRPEHKSGQLMNKCTFALPINSSMKDVGKQVLDIMHDRSMKSGEHFYGPDMARCIQEEVTNIARMFKLDPNMKLPFEQEFAGPEPQPGVQPPTDSRPAPTEESSSTPRQMSKDEGGGGGGGGGGGTETQEPAAKFRVKTVMLDDYASSNNTPEEEAAIRESVVGEVTKQFGELSLSDLSVVKQLVESFHSQAEEPMVVVPGSGGQERRLLRVPVGCFFSAVPRKPMVPSEGYDVVKGGIGDKFVVSYPSETQPPRVWCTESVLEPVLIMPNDRLYTIDRPAVLHKPNGADGAIELMRLPADDRDKLIFIQGGHAFNIEGPALHLPERGVFALPAGGDSPASGSPASVVVQIADGGNYTALLERPSLLLPVGSPKTDPSIAQQMRVVELPSNPNLEGLDFMLSMLQLLRSESAAQPDGVLPASEQVWRSAAPVATQSTGESVVCAVTSTTGSVVASSSSSSGPPNGVADNSYTQPVQSNNQNHNSSSSQPSAGAPTERQSRPPPEKGYPPPKRKNSKEKMGGHARASGDNADGYSAPMQLSKISLPPQPPVRGAPLPLSQPISQPQSPLIISNLPHSQSIQSVVAQQQPQQLQQPFAVQQQPAVVQQQLQQLQQHSQAQQLPQPAPPVQQQQAQQPTVVQQQPQQPLPAPQQSQQAPIVQQLPQQHPQAQQQPQQPLPAPQQQSQQAPIVQQQHQQPLPVQQLPPVPQQPPQPSQPQSLPVQTSAHAQQKQQQQHQVSYTAAQQQKYPIPQQPQNLHIQQQPVQTQLQQNYSVPQQSSAQQNYGIQSHQYQAQPQPQVKQVRTLSQPSGSHLTSQSSEVSSQTNPQVQSQSVPQTPYISQQQIQQQILNQFYQQQQQQWMMFYQQLQQQYPQPTTQQQQYQQAAQPQTTYRHPSPQQQMFYQQLLQHQQQQQQQQVALMRAPVATTEKTSQITRPMPAAGYSAPMVAPQRYPTQQTQWPVFTQPTVYSTMPPVSAAGGISQSSIPPSVVTDSVVSQQSSISAIAMNSPRKQGSVVESVSSEPNCQSATAVPAATVPSSSTVASVVAPSTSSNAIAATATTIANGVVPATVAATTCPPPMLVNGVSEGPLSVAETTIGRFSIVTVNPSSVDD